MAHIACYANDKRFIGEVVRQFHSHDHTLTIVPADTLNAAVRASAYQHPLDLILLELTPQLSNLHLFLFLRSDQATRHVPIVVVSHDPALEAHALALGTNRFVSLPAPPQRIANSLVTFLPEPVSIALGAPRTAAPF
ncbi:MAG: hypothetical protein Fur005_45140 [Roseiflexaceae bacterium]